MTSPFEIKQAARSAVKPLVGFYGKSGSGKTMSALLFARGLVGPKGRVILIDSENRRGSYFSDLIPGGYQVIDLDPPFSPERYSEAIDAAEAQADCIVIDSFSHEHAGEGGVLDMQDAELNRMAGDDWKKREACKMAAWIKPKMAHKKLVGRLLRSKVALICCLRGEEKTHIVKENNQTKVITDDFSTPIADSKFIFELLLNFETVNVDGQGGYVYPIKITHPAIAPLLPQAGKQQIGIPHGEALARWCAAPSASAPAGQPSGGPVGELAGLKADLWALTKNIHLGKKENMGQLEQWLIDECHITPDEQLASLSADRLRDVLAKLKGGRS